MRHALLLAIVLAAGRAAAGEPAPAAAPAAVPVAGFCFLAGDLPSGVLRWVCVDAFAIDRTEVTVAAWRACVAAKRCKAPPERIWNGLCAYHRAKHDDHPMDCVTWAQAQQFCVDAGGRLPTEAEFELAGHGPAESLYPWGDDEPTCERAALVARKGEAAPPCLDPSREELALPVCSRPTGNGPGGVCDLAGNASEWASDWFAPVEKNGDSARAERNPRGPCPGKTKCRGHVSHVVKGGGNDVAERSLLRLGARRTGLKAGSAGMGFRCVRPSDAKDSPAPHP
jgi:formylglycine-generating enzyme required for sulfatase activity